MVSDSDQEIIDLIDQHQYGYAQSLLLQKIKKFPQRTLYPLLQNRILYRTGHKQQAIEKNVQLLKSIPNDVDSIIMLSEFFQDVGMEKEADACWENVIQRYPIKAEELVLLWFENSVLQLNAAKFNKIFLYLNKSKKERKYTFWYAFSFYLMIMENEKNQQNETKKVEKQKDVDTGKLNLYKSFGKKLIERAVDGLSFANCQEIYVYTRFLLLDKDYSSIESLLAQTKFSLDLELQILYLESMKQNKNWEKLHAYTENLLFEKKFDDYDTWLLWIQASKELEHKYENVGLKLGCNDSKNYSRNKLLTNIELRKLYGCDYTDAIEAYYNVFKSKLCCYNDLSKINIPDTIDNRIKASTHEIILSQSLNQRDTKSKITLVNNQKFHSLVDNWEIYKLFSSQPSEKSEFDNDPINELTLISVVSSLAQASVKEQPRTIVVCIAIITELLKKDEHNYKLKLWLLKLYSQLNTNDQVIPIYQSLKIKMVQHETLGHYLNNAYVPIKSTLDELINVFRFFLTSTEEIKDTVQNGFEHEVYNKLASFISFGQKLQNSVSLNTTIQRIIQLSLVLNDTGYLGYFVSYLKEHREEILEENYTDNRDYETEWNSICVNDELKKAKTENLMRIPTDNITLKIKLIIYSLVFESDESGIAKLIKAFNRLLGSPGYKPDPFTTLLNKLYHNLLNMANKPKSNNEVQSLFNFVQKNLKWEKLQPLLVPQNILSSQLNQNLINLAEFTKIVQSLAQRKPSSYLNQILVQCKTISAHVKKEDFVKRQLASIDGMNLSGDDFPFDFDIQPILNDIKNSVSASTKSILNSI